MPIAFRLNIADIAFPISQWTEAGATRIAPRVSLTKSGFSGCSAMTARIADVSITISTAPYCIIPVQLYKFREKRRPGSAPPHWRCVPLNKEVCLEARMSRGVRFTRAKEEKNVGRPCRIPLRPLDYIVKAGQPAHSKEEDNA